jgi:hypothetical protein
VFLRNKATASLFLSYLLKAMSRGRSEGAQWPVAGGHPSAGTARTASPAGPHSDEAGVSGLHVSNWRTGIHEHSAPGKLSQDPLLAPMFLSVQHSFPDLPVFYTSCLVTMSVLKVSKRMRVVYTLSCDCHRCPCSRSCCLPWSVSR